MRILLFLSFGSLFAATPWPSFEVGQRVEIDGACFGTWKRATILSSQPDRYDKTATRYSVKFDDGHEWTFSGPGIVAPCIRPMSAAAAMAVKPPAGFSGPRLQGLYLQLQPFGTSNQYVHYYFWPDGRLCLGLPTGGLDREPVDFASIQKQKNCGTYRIAGNQIRVQWQGDAPHDETLVNFRTTSFEMNGYTTAKMPSYGSGRLLNGSYTGTVMGNQMRKQTYTFRNDGTYQLNDQPVTSLDGVPKSDRGTYRLSNNTLELAGASGKLRLTAYPFPTGTIMIENTVFTEK